MSFQVGDMVRVHGDEIYVEGNSYSWVQEYFDMVDNSKSFGSARSNDPTTSKKAARTPRVSLRERVAIVINGGHYEPRPEGWTGHELAAKLVAPLNSVTPRLAELRRAERIKDSGQRRDGQIVWVVA